MSQTYTPVATSHGSFTLPSDGDPAVAESVNDALRDLADNSLVALNTSASALAIALQAINGTTGGTYTPAADIIIDGPGGIQLNAGADLTLSGASIFSVTGIISINNASVQVLGPISIAGATFVISEDTSTTFGGSVVIEELIVASLDVRGSISLGNESGDEMVVEATSTFISPATFEAPVTIEQLIVASLDVRGNSSLGNQSSDTISILGTMTLETPLGYSEAGRVPYREVVILPAGGATLTVEDGDVFRVPQSTTGSFTLSTTNARPGDKMRFYCQSSLSDSAFISAGSSSITMSAGVRTFAEFVYTDDSAWDLTMFSVI